MYLKTKHSIKQPLSLKDMREIRKYLVLKGNKIQYANIYGIQLKKHLQVHRLRYTLSVKGESFKEGKKEAKFLT